MSFVSVDFDLATESATRYADDIAYAGGGYVLTETTPGDGAAHKVTIKGNAATNHSAKTFTLTGIDQNDRPQTEDLAGPNGAVTVTSTKYFKELTSVTVSATTNADTFDIGFADEVMSRDIPVPIKDVALLVQCDVTGTINYGAQVTLAAPGTVGALWVADGNVTGETTDQLDYLSKYGISMVRFVVNSYSAGAELHAYVVGR